MKLYQLKDLLLTLERSLKDIMNNEKDFGGKIDVFEVIFGKLGKKLSSQVLSCQPY